MTQRSDALENRDALMSAARSVFAESGIDAPLDLIRKRADVGRATMYRHFPDRRAFHIALLEDSLARLEALGHADRPAGLAALLTLAAREAAHSTALHAVWNRLRDDPDAAPLIARLRSVFAGPLARAQAAGRATAWLTVDDLLLTIRMLGSATRGPTAAAREAEALRALRILAHGLATDPQHILGDTP